MYLSFFMGQLIGQFIYSLLDFQQLALSCPPVKSKVKILFTGFLVIFLNIFLCKLENYDNDSIGFPPLFVLFCFLLFLSKTQAHFLAPLNMCLCKSCYKVQVIKCLLGLEMCVSLEIKQICQQQKDILNNKMLSVPCTAWLCKSTLFIDFDFIIGSVYLCFMVCQCTQRGSSF